MKISKKIIDRLKTDKKFRLETGLALNVGETAIREMAKNNAINGSLTKTAAVNYFKSKGFTDSEIFE